MFPVRQQKFLMVSSSYSYILLLLFGCGVRLESLETSKPDTLLNICCLSQISLHRILTRSKSRSILTTPHGQAETQHCQHKPSHHAVSQEHPTVFLYSQYKKSQSPTSHKALVSSLPRAQQISLKYSKNGVTHLYSLCLSLSCHGNCVPAQEVTMVFCQ